MSQQELLIYAARTLDQAGVPYLVTGSFVSSYYGEPRASHDIDLVVELSPEAIPAILAAFPEDRFYIDEESIREAVAHHSMFNVLSLESFDKLDFWLVTPDPWDRSRLARRVAVSLGGASIWMPTPEDAILAKLKWSKDAGGSEKQLRDVLRVYEVQLSRLDQPYLDRWAAHLGVTDTLSAIRDQAEPLRS